MPDTLLDASISQETVPTSAVILAILGLSPRRSLLGQSLPADTYARHYSLGGRESAGLLRSVGPFDAARGSPLVHRPCWLAPRVSEGTYPFPSTQDSNFCCRSANPSSAVRPDFRHDGCRGSLGYSFATVLAVTPIRLRGIRRFVSALRRSVALGPTGVRRCGRG